MIPFLTYVYPVAPTPFAENVKCLCSLLVFAVSDDNSAIIYILVPLCIISFSLAAFNILSLCWVFRSFIMICLRWFILYLSCWELFKLFKLFKFMFLNKFGEFLANI